jgi:transcriptional regulator with XRE-family HTH domain
MCNYCIIRIAKEVQDMTELKSRRLQRKITQKEAAERIGISLRSYIMYENDESKEGTPKYRFLLQEMDRIILLDE